MPSPRPIADVDRFGGTPRAKPKRGMRTAKAAVAIRFPRPARAARDAAAEPSCVARSHRALSTRRSLLWRVVKRIGFRRADCSGSTIEAKDDHFSRVAATRRLSPSQQRNIMPQSPLLMARPWLAKKHSISLLTHKSTYTL